MATQFYQTPLTLIDEIGEFERQIKNFRSGILHPTEFKGLRVAFGVYEQRKSETFMVRIRCSAGGITPKQLFKASELSEKYGNSHIHVTTRQEIQLHYVNLEDVPTVMRELNSVGLSTRGGGGNTVRNIMASYNTGIALDEEFDVEPYVVALSTRLIAELDSWNLPRKFKMSFSSNSNDNANATIQDLGFIAKIENGSQGFEVWTAGGMGRIPDIGHKLLDWIPGVDLYRVVKALKNMFHNHGDRVNKSKNRLRFLWKDLTGDVYIQYFNEEFEKVKNDPNTKLTWDSVNTSDISKEYAPIELPSDENVDFNKWKSRFAEKQKQDGLWSVKVTLLLGDILTKDVKHLTDLLIPLGDNHIRLSMDQNIYLRNIPEDYLTKVYITLKSLTNLYDRPKLYSNIISCTGADTCKLGICLPRGLTPKIHQALDFVAPEIMDKLGDLKINISGCPNSCGQHHIGDLGFYGRIKNLENRNFPAYQILGGAVIKPGGTKLAQDSGWIHSRDLPNALKDILIAYEKVKDNYTTFAQYFENEGKESIGRITESYNSKIPTFDQDKNYYFDWGADKIFSTEGMGAGECSAGLFDMIGVDKKFITDLTRELCETSDSDERDSILKKIVYHTSRMLLVTRGVESKSDLEVYNNFITHFIEKRLISSRYSELLNSVKNNEPVVEKEVLNLAADVIYLYGTMDRSMKFKGETSSLTGDPSNDPTKESVNKKFKDLTGVACPMNFVKTKMELSQLNIGDELEILLDSGAPIENVPKSVQSEGHEILLTEQVNNHWRVKIKKN